MLQLNCTSHKYVWFYLCFCLFESALLCCTKKSYLRLSVKTGVFLVFLVRKSCLTSGRADKFFWDDSVWGMRVTINFQYLERLRSCLSHSRSWRGQNDPQTTYLLVFMKPQENSCRNWCSKVMSLGLKIQGSFHFKNYRKESLVHSEYHCSLTKSNSVFNHCVLDSPACSCWK